MAPDSEESADRVIDQLLAGFRLLIRNPGIGRCRDDLRPGSRTFVVGQYVIVYRASHDRLTILGVFHGKRDFARLTKQARADGQPEWLFLFFRCRNSYGPMYTKRSSSAVDSIVPFTFS